ncbi:YciI family protein [Streptomyces sp. NPDC002514]|uniref:YciI family protein n=1 Tax=Streptomyces sp. NPDC001270 TaxID=3364554 RepID=UPI0036CB0FF4
MAGSQHDVEQLLAPMIKKRLYAAVNRRVAAPEVITPYVADHLRYMTDLEERGLLWASGPFVEPGVQVGDGLTILNTATADEAVTLLRNEPLARRGLRTFDGPFLWELREGRIPVRLNASTSMFRLE